MTTRKIALLCALMITTVSLTACEDKAKEKTNETTKAEATTPDTTPATTPKEEAKPQGTDGEAKVMIDPGDENSGPVTMAVAVLHPTKDNTAAGVVRFEETPEGLKVTTEMKGLTKEGKHAHHIHLYGDCSGEDGKTAGTHFNFKESAKNPPKDIKRITGDLGDLQADAEGNAKAEVVIKDASLHGKFSILGRAIIVHEKGNDHNHPPIGATGGRLSCGVIGLTEAQ